MESAKLNVFQRLVRQWDSMHPYNAAQVMQLARIPDDQTLTDTWHETLAELGLGRVRVTGRSYRFESLNGDLDRCAVSRFNRDTGLCDLLTQELNRPFDPDDELPLRAFVVEADMSRFLGVVYHHWVADSASIRLLLREWFFRMFDSARARRTPLRAAPNGYWRLFGPERGGWRLDEGVLASMRWSSRMRRVRRIEVSDFDNYRTHFTTHSLTDANALLTEARRRRATLNDVFLAAIAEVCDRHAPVQRTPRRQDLALGAIVDLRARAEDDLSDLFGLFLGFTSVICRPRDLEDWDRLLRCVARQNRMHKHRAAPESSMIRMLGGLIAHRVLGPERIKKFYRKRIPLAGGISNVNLNGSWVEQYHPSPILDYIRVSPCGPMLPLVFTPTTLGSRVNFGLTCRESVVPIQTAMEMSRTFTQRLMRFANRVA